MQSTNGADWREEGTFFCEARLHIFAVVMWIKIIWHGYFIYNFFFMSKLNNLLGKWHSFLIKRRVVRSNTQMFCRAWFGPVTGRLWELLSLTLRLFSPKSSLTFSFFWKCNRSCAVQLMDFIKQTQSSFYLTQASPPLTPHRDVFPSVQTSAGDGHIIRFCRRGNDSEPAAAARFYYGPILKHHIVMFCRLAKA